MYMTKTRKLSFKEKERRIREIKEILAQIRENPAEKRQIEKLVIAS